MLFEGWIDVAQYDALNLTCENPTRFFHVTIATGIKRSSHDKNYATS